MKNGLQSIVLNPAMSALRDLRQKVEKFKDSQHQRVEESVSIDKCCNEEGKVRGRKKKEKGEVEQKKMNFQ